jgi:putrescine transport system substrate-binding protein
MPMPHRAVLLAAFAALTFLAAPSAGAQENVVKVYNWSDYIDPDILAQFTEKTGIKVVYDVFDSNDILETKLLAGSTGYDVVVPSGNFLANQIKAGVFAELDKSKLPNWKNLDPKLMARVAKYDPGNEHAFIYMWGTTGIAYNVDKIKERMADAPVDSWDMIFKPEIIKKFADCGIYALDAPDEVIPAALNYLGLDPDSKDPEVIAQGAALVKSIRPYIRKFHSSETINAIANGDICLALMWSGDAGIAASRAEESGNGVKVEYSIPTQGAQLWLDMMAMPKDAPNPDAAYAFMNYILDPEVIAKASDFVTYPNGNAASVPLVDEALRDDPNVYPPPEVMEKLFVVTPNNQRQQKALTRLWTDIVAGG